MGFLLSLIFIASTANYIFSISVFIDDHKEIAKKINEDFKGNVKLDNIYVVDNKIFIQNIETKKFYILLQSHIVQIEDDNKNQLNWGFKLPIKKNISILIPQNIILFVINSRAFSLLT